MTGDNVPTNKKEKNNSQQAGDRELTGQLKHKVSNNRLIAWSLAIATAVIALSSFTDAIDKMWTFYENRIQGISQNPNLPQRTLGELSVKLGMSIEEAKRANPAGIFQTEKLGDMVEDSLYFAEYLVLDNGEKVYTKNTGTFGDDHRVRSITVNFIDYNKVCHESKNAWVFRDQVDKEFGPLKFNGGTGSFDDYEYTKLQSSGVSVAMSIDDGKLLDYGECYEGPGRKDKGCDPIKACMVMVEISNQ